MQQNLIESKKNIIKFLIFLFKHLFFIIEHFIGFCQETRIENKNY